MLLHALPVTFGVLALFFYWFALANRTVLFLYDHDMGPLFPDTGPFSLVTRSRYWMTGLVAAGMVLVLYTMAALLWGRVRQGYRPPPWRRVWLCCAVPLAVGIPLVTLTLNAPAPPVADALLTTAVALAGLAFALTPAGVAVAAPARFGWLTLAGLGVAALVQSLTLLEQAAALAQRGSRYGYFVVAAGLLTGVAILAGGALARRWRRQAALPISAQLAAGVCWGYLLLPAAHYLFFTDGWFYITTADNFFPHSWGLLLAGWAATGAITAAFWLVEGRR